MVAGMAEPYADTIKGASPSEAPVRGETRWPGEATAPAVRLLDHYLAVAADSGASDLHFEPSGGRMQVRVRIDGSLRALSPPPRGLESALLTRARLLSRVNLAERRLPCDGRFHWQGRSSVTLDLRASFLPVDGGEKLVLRLMPGDGRPRPIEDLGMDEADLALLETTLARPSGMLVCAGPTGAGKTSTLYAALARLATPRRATVTVEDPVEMRLDGVTQVQVDDAAGRSFAVVLRSLLRQDPDVVMIGEMRDGESAAIACRAALTGHLVLTTLHTADTLEAVVRLRDMGVASYLVSATVSLVVAQRLLRKLCRHCRRQSEPAAHESQLYRACGLAVPRVLARAVGCRCCRGEGYSGRSAVFEVMNRDGGVDRPPRRTLMAAALVAAGRFDTSFEEAVAACPGPRQSVAGANDR